MAKIINLQLALHEQIIDNNNLEKRLVNIYILHTSARTYFKMQLAQKLK